MKQSPIILLLILVTGLCSSFENRVEVRSKATDIVGDWYTSSRNYIVTIYQKDGLYHGKISWMAEPNNEDGNPKRDIYNPDKSKQNQLITGVHLLYDFRFDGKETWEEGVVYDPRNGKSYSGRIVLKDFNTLELRAFLGIPLLGKTIVWDRKIDH